MKALLIEWNPNTGKRAGNISPKDPNLICHSWQNMNIKPAIELRLVMDNRDISQYDDIKGVSILYNKNEINDAIDNNFPPKIVIEDKLFYEEHIKEQIGNKKLKINDLPYDRNKRLKVLKNKYGIIGIVERKPQKV